MDIWIVSFILLTTVILLISEKLPVDITAIGIITALSISGILTPVEAVSGFANPAVVTVGAMFLISKGMIRTGAVEVLSSHVIDMTRGNPKAAMLLLIFIGSICSAFINNTPVVVLFIPVIMSMCCRFNLFPSKYLIPLSYVSILGGTCTLIGTSTNIIVSDLSAEFGYGEFGMFELAKVGLPVAISGIAFLLLAAPRLMPENINPACELDSGLHTKYLAEILISQESDILNQPPVKAFKNLYPDLEIIEIIRSERLFHPLRDKISISAGDMLLVKGEAGDLVHLIQEKGISLPYAEKFNNFMENNKEWLTIEVIIPPQSSLIGERLQKIFLFNDPDFHIIAFQRRGIHYIKKNIPKIMLKTGDILLINLPWKRLDELRAKSDLIVFEDVHHKIIHKKKAGISFIIFAAMIVLASTGILNIMISAIAAVFFMFITGCLHNRDAYRALQGDVLVLIAGTIALGAAMEKTGASRFYAGLFLELLSGWPPHLILFGFILVTSFSTQILSNNATAVLLLPIAISTALELGAAPKPFIMAVCFGASACFATPIGYQTNLLVYGPGGYRFMDYFKLGIGLNFIIIIGGALLIPYFWPL